MENLSIFETLACRVCQEPRQHEKRFHSEMAEMEIESFLPMRKELHEWSDQKKWVEVPLFSSYVFANVTSEERNRVYALNGFVRFVSSNGKPSIVPQGQMDGIKKIVDSYPDRVEVLESDYIGTRGVILSGPPTACTVRSSK